MKLIVGLGNPGKNYEKNRHNLGYMVLDKLVLDLGLTWKKDADFLSFISKDSDNIYIKPTTFMNDSGEAICAVSRYFGVDPKDILVVHDDLDLEFGKIRLAFGGSSAGHHGIDSAIERLATPDFARLRIGIGHPEVGKGTGHVLGNFSDREKKELKKLIDTCVAAVKSYLDMGIEATMNRFNRQVS